MTHPRENEIFLLKRAIKSIPPIFPRDEREKMFNIVKDFENNPEAKAEDIEAAIVKVGKESWAHRKAYEDLVAGYAQDKLQEFVKKAMSNGLRKKYEEFKKAGGDIKDFRRGKEFEEAFTPEENLEIEQAFFSAREELSRYIEDIIKKHRDEYEESLKLYEQKQRDLDNMIESLREFALKSEKWAPQILDKVKRFEQGWSAVERDFDEDKLKHEIEYWEGVIGLE